MPEITLSVTENQIDSLIRLTKEDLPNESCCLLLGRIVNDNEYCVELVKIMENKTRSEYSFQMDPDELKEAYQWAANDSLDVVGVLSFAFGWFNTFVNRLDFYELKSGNMAHI